MISKFHKAKLAEEPHVVLWGSGKPRREFLHVDDLAKAVLLCIDKYDDSQQINVGSGEEVTINHLATKISSLVRFNGEIIWDLSKPDGTPRKILDSSKIAKLGWAPLISLDSGLKSTVEWYLQNKQGV